MSRVQDRIARGRAWWAGVAVGLMALALSLAPATAHAALTVHITSGVDPAAVTVPRNTAVTFVNDDGDRHRIRTTAGPVEFDSGDIAPGQSFTVTLSSLGTYSYRDDRTKAASYQGTIVVSDAVTTTVPGSPGTTAAPAPAHVDVTIGDRVFSPSSVTIASGGSVTWTNRDTRAHTVTASDHAWDSGVLNPGQTWSHTFPNGGTFSYFCIIHPDMTGRVAVTTPGGGTPPPPPPTTTTQPPTTVPATTPAPTTTLPGTPPPTSASVMIMNMAFSPATVTIAAGGTVNWVNHDTTPHTVTADDRSYDSGMMMQSATFSRKFATPGTYRYHCDFHPEMVATVIVLAPGATVPPGTTPPPTTIPAHTGHTTTTTVPAGGGGGGAGGGTTLPPGAPLPTTGSVTISASQFAPGTITIAVGGTVTWTNADALPHTVTASDASFDSGMMMIGDSWSHTFTAPGTYTYSCTFHPVMTGTIVVATPDDPTPPVVTGGGHSSHAASGGSTGGGGATSGSSGPVAAGEASVHMAGSQFNPVSVEVGTGGAVTWTNDDTMPHTVTADDGSFDSGTLMPGDTFSFQFDTAGTVSYRCSFHPGMTGQVVVSALPAAPAGDHAAHGGGQSASGGGGGTQVAEPAASSDELIVISGGSFPAVTTIAAGHSVTWRNDDAIEHVVKALDGAFESDVLAPGESFTFTFDEPGVHPYTCDIHAHMGGTLIVMPADDVDLADAVTVQVTNHGFEPADITVHQGETVVWAFGGELPHTVTADDGSFDSGVLQPGQTFSFTFDELGDFTYACQLHATMTAVIRVVPADAEIVPGATTPPTTAAAAGVPADGAGPDAAGVTSGSGGGSTSIVIGIGVGIGLLVATALALGVGVVSRKTPRLA